MTYFFFRNQYLIIIILCFHLIFFLLALFFDYFADNTSKTNKQLITKTNLLDTLFLTPYFSLYLSRLPPEMSKKIVDYF